jgi:hypothetical protein
MIMEYVMRDRSGLFLALTVLMLFSPMFVAAYQAAPVAITREVTFVTEKSAKLGGRVNANEMLDAKQWFEWGLSGQSGVVYETPHYAIGGSQLVDTNADIVGLAPNKQYFYRQIAENGRGHDVGQTVYFTTKPLPAQINPIVLVQTNDASSITESGAMIKGYVSPHGNATTKWWFQWGETNKFENETYKSGFGQDSGPVTMTLTALTPGTVYYFRLAAENSDGRVYGNTRIFVTLGTPPKISETPREQSIPTPEREGDGVTRNTTTAGGAGAQAGTQGGTPGVAVTSGGILPGDIFGAFFGRKLNSGGVGTGVVSGTAAAPQPSTIPLSASPEAQAPAQAQVAGTAAAGGPLGTFWNTLTGKKDVELVIEKVGPKKVPTHTPVEYRIRYAYFLSEPANSAALKIILPAEVVYIGDNTTNELLLEESAGPEHTYVLPLGRLEKGSTRTVSILGMTTGDANGFPDARARIEYTGAAGGVHVVSAQSGTVSKSNEAKTASVSGSDIGVLPSSLLGWVLYIAFVAGVIFVLRKAKSYYDKRKEEIALEEEDAARRAQANAGFSGPRVV